MTNLRDCSDPEAWEPHLEEAVLALRNGGLVVLPTDTVYGIGADAFTPDSVAALLRAKGRGRHKPPPVLIGDAMTMDALATDVSADARALADEFWPGPLTLILKAQPSLMWDLGETEGTVALRVPNHPCALELLQRTGPLAVSSANRSGQPPSVECAHAAEQLRDAVEVYLDAGETPGQVPSTIVDCTGEEAKILRPGALSTDDLGRIVPSFLKPAAEEQEESDGATQDGASPE